MSITDDTAVQSPEGVPSEATIDLTDSAASGPESEGSGGLAASGRPQFSITDAAVACAVSRKTITRKLGDLAEHGAAKDDDGVWRIPVEALLAVGLHPGRSVAERPEQNRPAATQHADPRPAPNPAADVVTVPRDRWDDLRIRLARAEAQAAEREHALADARLALRALTAGPARVVDPVAAPDVAPAPAEPVPLMPSRAGVEPEGVQAPVPGEPPQQAPVTLDAPQQAPVTLDAPQQAPAAVVTDTAGELARARQEAARTGGYVPAATPPPKRRRWWHSKGA